MLFPVAVCFVCSFWMFSQPGCTSGVEREQERMRKRRRAPREVACMHFFSGEQRRTRFVVDPSSNEIGARHKPLHDDEDEEGGDAP